MEKMVCFKVAAVTLIFLLIEIVNCAPLVEQTAEDGQHDEEKARSECASILSPELISEIQSYRGVAERIIEAAMEGSFKGTTYTELDTFVDGYGSRIAGSEALEKSIDYMVDKMEELGLDNVHTENVTAPKWVRGFEQAFLLRPYKKTISVLGLAMSKSTSEDGITGHVIVVSDFDDLQKNVKNASGHIIVFNAPWDNPENAIKYRQRGAIEGAKLNAAAVLVRSYATFSLSTPHTGLMFYQKDVPQIPAGEISIEDAELLHRLYKKGERPVVHVRLSSEDEGEIITRNSVGDLTGTLKPEEFVLISGHIDSYDVGQGALDDGYGVVLSIKTLQMLKSLDLIPKRTIRTILWTAEEVGEVPFGAQQYLNDHREELMNNYTTFLEADSGIFNAHGLIFNGTKEAGCIMREILSLLSSINATKLYSTFPRLKTDIVPLMQGTGVSGALIATDADKYFWYHHSQADTMTSVNSRDLDVCLSMWGVLSYVLGDLSIMLPRSQDTGRMNSPEKFSVFAGNFPYMTIALGSLSTIIFGIILTIALRSFFLRIFKPSKQNSRLSSQQYSSVSINDLG